MPRPPWQSEFPVPPRKTDGFMNGPPLNRTDRYSNSNKDFWNEGSYDQKPPRGFREQQPRDYRESNGSYDQRGRSTSNRPPPSLMDQNLGNGMLKPQRPTSTPYRSEDVLVSQSPNRPNKDFHGGNRVNDQAPYNRRQEPPSLLSNPVVPLLNSLLNQDFRIPKSTPEKQPPRPTNRYQQNKSPYASTNNQNNRHQPNNQINNRQQTNRRTPFNNREASVTPEEKRALSADVTSAFFDRVKPLNMMQIAADVALEFARKEIHEKRGGNTSLLNSSFSSNNNSCTVCKLNFPSRGEVTDHFKSTEHRELEDLFNLKKEQARLILNKRIIKPTIQSPPESKPAAKPEIDVDLLAISKAEVEMELKPSEMDLDPYILGIYESIMKPYWPNPTSKFYCRICNYKEFNDEKDFNQHNATKEHKEHEQTYDQGFCLYCQIHNGSQSGMEAHSNTQTHEKIKDLMERSKQCAIEHWHKVNKLELPEKYKNLYKPPTKAKDEQKQLPPQQTKPQQQRQDSHQKLGEDVGSKRSAPDPPDSSLKSPVKKPAMSKENPVVNRRNETQNEVNKDRKSSSSSAEMNNRELLPREKVWFIPISGFMCAACQVFVEEKNQKAHAKEITHNTNVIKFKRQINS